LSIRPCACMQVHDVVLWAIFGMLCVLLALAWRMAAGMRNVDAWDAAYPRDAGRMFVCLTHGARAMHVYSFRRMRARAWRNAEMVHVGCRALVGCAIVTVHVLQSASAVRVTRTCRALRRHSRLPSREFRDGESSLSSLSALIECARSRFSDPPPRPPTNHARAPPDRRCTF